MKKVGKRYYRAEESILFNSRVKEWRVLSNMHPCSIYYNGIRFESSEMLYWWLRFQGEGMERQRVRDSLIAQHGYWNGFECKRIAKENAALLNPDIDEWDCLLVALRAKAEFCSEFREALIKSKGKNLVELAPWDVKKYGAAPNPKSGLIEGGNGCGRLMMFVRESL